MPSRNHSIGFEYKVGRVRDLLPVFLIFIIDFLSNHCYSFIDWPSYCTTYFRRCLVFLHVVLSIFLSHSILIVALRIYTRLHLSDRLFTALFTATFVLKTMQGPNGILACNLKDLMVQNENSLSYTTRCVQD